jgi:hypothetical protein
VDRFRIARRNLFDFHTAFGACHHHGFSQGAVDEHREVEFPFNPHLLFNQHLAHLLTFRSGLVRNKLHTKNLAGYLLGVLDGVGELDATALAASAGMDLRLYDNLSAQLLSDLPGLLRRRSHTAVGHRHPELSEHILSLILVDLHNSLLSPPRWRYGGKS